jgi:hypothetical protein
MRNFIMTWNPTLWPWDKLNDQIKQLGTSGKVEEPWSCGNRKDLPVGSRVFLFKQGEKSKGIIGAGFTLSEPKEEPHFNPNLAKKGKVVKRVNINWYLLNSEPVISLDQLKILPFSKMSWVFQSSGVEIKSDIADALMAELSKKKEIKSAGPVTLDQVERAFKILGGEGVWDEILHEVTKLRNNDHSHYKNKHNYEKTAFQIIQTHCPGYKKYGGDKRFEKTGDVFQLVEGENFSRIIEKASSYGGGGEGYEHKRLKEYVAKNPVAVGLSAHIKEGETEFKISSGDSIDVYFQNKKDWIGVEVKSLISSEADLTRGLFQCIKYKAVMEAMQLSLGIEQNAYSILALEGELPSGLVRLKKILGIEVVERVYEKGDVGTADDKTAYRE